VLGIGKGKAFSLCGGTRPSPRKKEMRRRSTGAGGRALKNAHRRQDSSGGRGNLFHAGVAGLLRKALKPGHGENHDGFKTV